MHTPQTLGLAFVHVGLLQVGKNFGAVEICLNEMAPAERTLINMHEKMNFFAIKAPFSEEKAGLLSNRS